MKIWLVAGASSGTGKTTVAQNLTEVLPCAEYLKIGHGKRKAKGSPNYFTSPDEGLRFIKDAERRCEHCVVESNVLAGVLEPDILIFLDRHGESRRDDADELRAAADVVIGRGGNTGKWRAQVGRLKLPSEVAAKVLEVFKAQHEFLAKRKLTIRTKIWFGIDGKVVFGEGLARLLQGIDSHGSLSKAVKEECISYRHAWGYIKRAEERLGFKLLERRTGGRSGGGSRLTANGRKMLDGYRNLKRKIIRESDRWFTELSEELGGSGRLK